MARLKVYTLGVNGFVRPEVIAALGEARHVRQARVLIVAATKAAGARLAADAGLRVSVNDSEYRVACGNDVNALADAGLCDQPAAYALPLGGNVEQRVIGLGVGGAWWPVGTLERIAGLLRLVPAEDKA